MAYTDMQYLGLFLPLTMLVYQITPKQYRQLVLLGLFALAAVMAAYFGGRAVESSPKGMVRNFFFFAALAAIIGILAVFKYTNFAITVIDRVFSWLYFIIIPRKLASNIKGVLIINHTKQF